MLAKHDPWMFRTNDFPDIQGLLHVAGCFLHGKGLHFY